MPNYADKLRALGLTNVQVVTILSGWTFDAIERPAAGRTFPAFRPQHHAGRVWLLRGEHSGQKKAMTVYRVFIHLGSNEWATT
jgi:hypothetical protein